MMGLWALVLVVIALRWPQHLLPAAIVCSVFEGAAIVNAGGLGISPYYFTLMLIAVQCVFVRVRSGNSLGYTAGVRRIIGSGMALLIIGLASAFMLPRVFHGRPVLSPRLNADAQAPLQFSTSNVGQGVYLLLNISMLWYTAHTCRTAPAARRMAAAFMIAGILVVALAVYQLASSLTGLPFPDDLLYSNDAYVMQHGTAILDMPRICSTFTEPAALAVFLIGFIAFLIARLETADAGGWRVMVLLVCAIVALVLSTSSTAYLGLAAIAAWGIVRHMFWPLIKGEASWPAVGVLVVLIGGAITAFALSQPLRDVVQTTVFEKDQSDSYEQRSQADRYSLKLAEDTWGLGVGLGSNRASSFFPSVMSTIGICGAAALGILIALLVLPGGDPSLRHLHRPLAAALTGIVFAKLISSPDLATPSMWAAMAALVSVRAAAEESPKVPTVTSSPPQPAGPARKQRSVSFG
jgi:hypothetical protein